MGYAPGAETWIIPGLLIKYALEKSSFQVMIAPLAPTLPPLGVMKVFRPGAGESRKSSDLRDEKNGVLRRP
jgi:hypothetical protein